jgi:cell division transport system permease protein
MRTWARQHARALAAAVAKISAQPMTSALGALVIGIALALPAGGYALLSNLSGLAQRTSIEPQLSLFMSPDAKAGESEALGKRLRTDPRLVTVRFVSRDEALAAMRRTGALAEVFAALERNPLPDAFVLRPRDAAPDALDALAGEYRKLPAVAHVQIDSDWARRLAALIRFAQSGIFLLGALLGIGLVAVTFNTIRLQILTQREEIEVAKLLGATDGFIRRPFFYLGAAQGLAGGAVALCVVSLSLAVLNRAVGALAATYDASFALALLGLVDASAVCLLAAFLGWLGAYLSVSIYLREIEPK